MHQIEWIFSGIGTFIISTLFCFAGYRLRKKYKQSQKAGHNAVQIQELPLSENETSEGSYRYEQNQKAGDNAFQLQRTDTKDVRK